MKNARALKDELDRYKRSYRRLATRNKNLELQHIAEEAKIDFLTRSLVSCQQAVDVNKNLLRQFGEEHARKENELVTLLTALKAKLREMGYNGNFDNLGNKNN